MDGRTPRRGAWIEIAKIITACGSKCVAPRAGVRGLKSCRLDDIRLVRAVAPRAGVRGLKFRQVGKNLSVCAVAPRAGVRGLKWIADNDAINHALSHPAQGCVD